MNRVRNLAAALSLAALAPQPAFASDYDELVIRHPTGRTNRLMVSIANALSGRPLYLQVTRHGRTLFGTSGNRNTGIISPFRERAWVFASMSVPTVGQTRSILTVRIAPVLYVSRQASADERSWHMPSRTQELDYRSTLLKVIRTAAAQACVNAQWSANEMSCS